MKYYKCRICGTKFFHVYTTPKGWPKTQIEIDRFELCMKHWHKEYNPELYKRCFKNSRN